MRRTEEMPQEWRRRNPPTIQTGNDLRNKEFPPISWAVPGVLPPGSASSAVGRRWVRVGWPSVCA